MTTKAEVGVNICNPKNTKTLPVTQYQEIEEFWQQLWEIVKLNRDAQHAVVHDTKCQTWLSKWTTPEDSGSHEQILFFTAFRIIQSSSNTLVWFLAQNCETINCSCLSHPLGGTLSQQPQVNTASMCDDTHNILVSSLLKFWKRWWKRLDKPLWVLEERQRGRCAS